MADKDYPTFKDLYEVQTGVDEKVDKVDARLSRLEKGFFVLLVLIASPKLGGPSASDLITAAVHHFA